MQTRLAGGKKSTWSPGMSASALGGPGLSGSPGPVLGSQACCVPTGLLFEGFSPFAFGVALLCSVDCFCFRHRIWRVLAVLFQELLRVCHFTLGPPWALWLGEASPWDAGLSER